jgi:hypothetical protein
MITKPLLFAMIVSICVGSGLAWLDLKTLADPSAEKKIDFNQVFADATPQGELNSSFRDQLRRLGWNVIITARNASSQSFTTGTVNRAHKSDRFLNVKSVLLEPMLLPYCEPVASRLVDPVLSRIVGHCDA